MSTSARTKALRDADGMFVASRDVSIPREVLQASKPGAAARSEADHRVYESQVPLGPQIGARSHHGRGQSASDVRTKHADSTPTSASAPPWPAKTEEPPRTPQAPKGTNPFRAGVVPTNDQLPATNPFRAGVVAAYDKPPAYEARQPSRPMQPEGLNRTPRTSTHLPGHEQHTANPSRPPSIHAQPQRRELAPALHSTGHQAA